MKLLENKVALITGAARGIGREIAIKFAAHGANIAFTDLKEDENFNSLINLLTNEYNVKCRGFVSDASKFNECEHVVNEVIKEFGNLNILVNNAGITRDTLLLRMNEEIWDLVINVNLKSVFNFTKASLRFLLKNNDSSIINISSVVGIMGNAGQANYAASKAGIIGFTKSIAKEYGNKGLRCNAIAPGFIETEMTKSLPEDIIKNWHEKIPMKRGGKPEEVANVALFLASNLSSYVNGQVISVCGGML